MAKIVVTGAGSAQANGVINSLLLSGDQDEIIGLGSEPTDLVMCAAHKKYLVPHSRSEDYRRSLLAVLNREQPDMIHFQHDAELAVALKFRDEIDRTGVKMLVPDYNTIDICVHKYKSWEKFKAAGIRVPENRILHDESDLRAAFKTLGDENGKIWLRSMSIGGGKGALPTNDFVEAREWIEKHDGWGTSSPPRCSPARR